MEFYQLEEADVKQSHCIKIKVTESGTIALIEYLLYCHNTLLVRVRKVYFGTSKCTISHPHYLNRVVKVFMGVVE